jgi:hypothetical protein
MADLAEEVRLAVNDLVVNLRSAAERNPDSPVDGADIDALIEGAKRAYPRSDTIQRMNPMGHGTTVGAALTKISLIRGAVIAEMEAGGRPSRITEEA